MGQTKNLKQRKEETLAEILDRRLGEISNVKSQAEVAREMGFPTPNFLSMIKKGKSKLALGRIGLLAEALEMELDTLFIAALRQYYEEDVIDLMRRTFAGPDSGPDTEAITKSERDLLDLARTHGDMQKGLSSATRQKIAEALTDSQPAVQ